MPKIDALTCHRVLNSRGDWTIETKLRTDNGLEVSQTIPDGASKGENEATYLPVDKAVEIVETVINDALKGEDPTNQEQLDRMMLEIDGTETKSHLGGNSVLSVSLALAKVSALIKGVPLYSYLENLYYGENKDPLTKSFPTPLFNILNGGKHAGNQLSFQEFMIIPNRKAAFTDCMDIGVKVYHSLRQLLVFQRYDIGVGDEGGFAPENLTVEKALELIKQAVSESYTVGKDVFFGLDVAAGSFHEHDRYMLREQMLELNSDELLNFYQGLLKKFELIYVEDPFYEKDFATWTRFNDKFGERLMVVGDDLVVTNKNFLVKAQEQKCINSVIVKPNQVGTLTETFEFIKQARTTGMQIIVSHRSGDTAEDTFISDLAFGIDADFIKAGSPVRGERVAKYNRLLDIYADINSRLN